MDSRLSNAAQQRVIAAAADHVAARHAFTDYRDRKSANTLRAHDADLILFGKYLHEVGIVVDRDFATDPESWRDITWGLVATFVKWMLADEYALGSINRALSTIKVYAQLAFKAGTMAGDDYQLIRTVKSYAQKEKVKVDQKREAAGVRTRKISPMTGRPRKKAEFIVLDEDQIDLMKSHDGYEDNPQGRMLRMMMCLFLDHGFRCSEIAALQVQHIDRRRGTITFFRQKTSDWETHLLTKDARQAIREYVDAGDAPPVGHLLRKTIKGGKLGEQGLSERSVTDWVNKLGKSIADVDGLSAHDGRHTWATRAAEGGTDTLALMHGGGWTSPAMPARYVKKAKITNEGVRLK